MNVNYAQSFYKSYGEGGAEISTSMVFDENSNISLIPKIGYSINGQLDIGLKYGVNLLDKAEYVETQSSYDITPYFLFHFFKQGDGGMPVSVLTGIGYWYGKTRIESNISGTVEATYNYVVVSYGFYRDFYVENNFRIQPRFIFEMDLGVTESSPEVYNETNNTSDGNSPTYFEISLPIIYSPSEKTDFFIAPLIAFRKSVSSFGFYIGASF
jgi:hypothetical protein